MVANHRFDELYNQGGIPEHHHVSSLVRENIAISLPERAREDFERQFRKILFDFNARGYSPHKHCLARVLLTNIEQMPWMISSDEHALRRYDEEYGNAFRRHKKAGAKMLKFQADKKYEQTDDLEE